MFHRSNLGSYGESLPCDIDGYVSEDGDRFASFNFDALWTPDADEWEEYVAGAVAATKAAVAGLEKWQEANA